MNLTVDNIDVDSGTAQVFVLVFAAISPEKVSSKLRVIAVVIEIDWRVTVAESEYLQVTESKSLAV